MTNTPANGGEPEFFKRLTPAEQEEFRRDAEAMEKAWALNPMLHYHPHHVQMAFHAARERVKLFVGGNRTGKTTAGVADDIIQCVDEAALPMHLRPYKKWQPPFKCRVITPDLSHTHQVVLLKFKEMVPREQLLGGSFDTAFSKSTRILRFNNGSQVDFMSYGMDRDQFGGVSLHRVHYDEEPGGPGGEEIRAESAWRLADYNGDEVYSMTPLFGYGWVKDDVWDRRNEEGIFAVQATIWDNPHLDQEGLKSALASCRTKEEYDARTKGDFVHFGGLFYPEFGEEHRVERPSRQHLKSQTVVVGIDPGLRRTGVVWVAFDEDNVALVFDELYPEEHTPAQVANLINAKNRFWGVRPEYVIDPSSRNRTLVNAEAVQAEFSRAGINCAYGQADRPAGILEVKGRLQEKTLLVSRELEHLPWEFKRYRRDPGAPDEFKSIKEHDHLLDALRYVILSRAWGAHFKPPASPQEERMWVPGTAPDFKWLDQAPGPSPPMGAMS